MSFTARYYSDCASEDCDNWGRIAPGQDVEYVDGELTHTACAKRERERGKSLGPYCGLCHMYHRGSCI